MKAGVLRIIRASALRRRESLFFKAVVGFCLMDAFITDSDKNISCERIYSSPVNGKECSFSELCWLAGLIYAGMSKPDRLDRLSQFFGVCSMTVRRWLSGQTHPHPCAIKLLYAYIGGVPMPENWSGWRMIGGQLVSNTGFTVGPDAEQKHWYLVNQINVERDRALKAERAARAAPKVIGIIAKLRALLSEVETL